MSQIKRQSDTEPRSTSLRWPVVLVHGMGGFDEIRIEILKQFPLRIQYFKGIKRLYLKQGVPSVYVVKMPRTGSIAARSEKLRKFAEERVSEERFHLIAHSMGGLDSRSYITNLGGAERVISLTTLGTPHRGSPLASLAFNQLIERIDGFMSGIGVENIFQRINYDTSACMDLCPERCADFNKQTPDVASVSYFSYAGDPPPRAVHPIFRIPFEILKRAENGGMNDGMVPVQSARWSGWRGTVPADHISLVNWQFISAASHCFSAKEFYLSLLNDLEKAERGVYPSSHQETLIRY